jgi:hypothetical protein
MDITIALPIFGVVLVLDLDDVPPGLEILLYPTPELLEIGQT